MAAIRIADRATGQRVVCREDQAADEIRPWYPDAPAEVADAIDRLDWYYLGLDAQRLGPDELDSEDWGRLVVWPDLTAMGKHVTADQVEILGFGISRARPRLGAGTETFRVRKHSIEDQLRAPTQWAQVRQLAASVAVRAQLAAVQRASGDRVVCEQALSRAKDAERRALEGRDAMIRAALKAGVSYRQLGEMTDLTRGRLDQIRRAV